jgi:hypothetical protein
MGRPINEYYNGFFNALFAIPHASTAFMFTYWQYTLLQSYTTDVITPHNTKENLT